MEISNFKTVVLDASEGMVLTQVEDVEILKRSVGKRVCLGKFSKPEDYKEITEEEGKKILEEQEAYRQELIKKMQEENTNNINNE